MPVSVTITGVSQLPPVFSPGRAVQLHVTWALDKQPASIDACLVYRTSGKGTRDAVSVVSESFPTPSIQGEWNLTLTLPMESPPSYDGKLLSVSWFAQVNAGKKEFGDAEMIVSPTGRPLVPQRMEK